MIFDYQVSKFVQIYDLFFPSFKPWIFSFQITFWKQLLNYWNFLDFLIIFEAAKLDRLYTLNEQSKDSFTNYILNSIYTITSL